jgi:hypothetical protein
VPPPDGPSADPWPDHVPVPSFGPRMVCTRCGIIGGTAGAGRMMAVGPASCAAVLGPSAGLPAFVTGDRIRFQSDLYVAWHLSDKDHAITSLMHHLEMAQLPIR